MWGKQFASLSLRTHSLAQAQRAHYVVKSSKANGSHFLYPLNEEAEYKRAWRHGQGNRACD